MNSRLILDVATNPDNSASLSDNQIMAELLSRVELNLGIACCQHLVIPCQTLPNPGVSGIIVASGFHFTCHTFSKNDAIYVDAFSMNTSIDCAGIKQHIKALYSPSTMTNRPVGMDFVGNFGRHLIFQTPFIDLNEMAEKTEQLIADIGMHKLSPVFIHGENGDERYDILQPITESHIAAHAGDGVVKIDVFSCKQFDDARVFAIFPEHSAVHDIPRCM